MSRASLCQPAPGLSCFACCPPIRPAGYDHADHRGSLRRLMSDNRAAWRRGELPLGPMTGFFCLGLGFLDSQGRSAGCLLHPARNQGRDLREPTGYAAKCARESCPPARAFAALEPERRQALIGLCAGLDPFEFSSPRLNPLMRLLARGPAVAGAAADLPGLTREEMAGWAWLARPETAWGWLLGLALAWAGPDILRRPDLDRGLAAAVERLSRGLGPRPPLDQGAPLGDLCDEWEARFWRGLSGLARAGAGRLERWRGLARAEAGQAGSLRPGGDPGMIE